MSLRAKFGWVLASYGVVLVASVWGYHHFKDYRDDLKFWIPQIFLLVLIAITTLYVLYTADLVEETKRLQQRPLIQVSFREVAEASSIRFDAIFEYGQSLLRGVVRLMGGEERQPPSRYLAIELKNIGQLTVRNLTIRINFAAPQGGSRIEEKSLGSEIKTDGEANITIAPASVPWMLVEVLSIVYGDGLRTHTEFVGTARFSTSVEQTTASHAGQNVIV
jgi:hypothetical protein